MNHPATALVSVVFELLSADVASCCEGILANMAAITIINCLRHKMHCVSFSTPLVAT